MEESAKAVRPFVGVSFLSRARALSRGVTVMFSRRNVVEALEGRRLFSFPVGIGSTGVDRIVSVASDRAGNVFVTGTYQGTVDFDPGAGTALLSGGGGFVARYAADGTLAWARGFVGTTPAKVAVDHGGGGYFPGGFRGARGLSPPETTHKKKASRGGGGGVCPVAARRGTGC